MGLLTLAVPAMVGAIQQNPLDTTFGTAGSVLTAVGSGGSATTVSDMLVEPDGNIVVVGTAVVASAHQLVLARYLPDGAPDPSFNGGSPILATFGDGGDTNGAGVVRQSGGDLVVAGDALDGGVRKEFVARYTPAGVLDSGFTDLSQISGGDASVNALAQDGEGRLLVAGSVDTGTSEKAFVTRYDPTVGRDPTFGAGGTTLIDLSSQGLATAANAVATQSSAVLLAGTATAASGDTEALAVKLTPGGQVDTAWGTNGSELLSLGDGTNTIARGVAWRQDGTAGVAGQTHAGGTTKLFVTQLTPLGMPDQSFASGGSLISDPPAGHTQRANAIWADDDGEYTIAGSDLGSSPSVRAVLVARITKAGAIAPTLTDDVGGPGLVTTTVGDGGDAGATALARFANGHRVIVGGHAVDSGATKLALVQYGAHLPPVAAFTATWDNHGFANKPARPGQVVTFDPSASTDPDGNVVKYEWDFTGGGTYTTTTATPDKQTHTYAFKALVPAGGSHAYTPALRVTDNDGNTDVVTQTVDVEPNLPPVPRLGLASAPALPLLLYAGIPESINASASSDPDGGIVKYQWDLDGNGSYEATTEKPLSPPHLFPHVGVYKIGLRVTDDEGASAAQRFKVRVGCLQRLTVGRATIANLRPDGCLHPSSSVHGAITRSVITNTTGIVINGITITPASAQSPITITIKRKRLRVKSLGISSSNATVSTVARQAPLTIWNGRLHWRISGGTITGFRVMKHATLGGLMVNIKPATLDGDKQTSTIQLLPHLPKNMSPPGAAAGVTPSTYQTVRLGGAQSSAAGGYDFHVENVPFGLLTINSADVYYAPLNNGDSLWGVNADITLNLLAEQIGVRGGLELLMQKGMTNALFHAAYLQATFNPAIDISGVFQLKDIHFQINMGPDFRATKLDGVQIPDPVGQDSVLNNAISNPPSNKTCVPIIGKVNLFDGRTWNGPGKPEGAEQPVSVKYEDMYDYFNQEFPPVEYPRGSGRMIGLGEVMRETFPHPNLFDDPAKPGQYYPNTPDIANYHVPDMAACGGVNFGLFEFADFEVDLGYAHYPGNLPNVFWFSGSGTIEHLINVIAQGEVWSDGFTHFLARADGEIPDILSWDVGFDFEAWKSQFDADAYAHVHIIPIDLSAGAEVLVSNKGLGVCLQLSFLGIDWTPGMTMAWGQGPTFYFSGCDAGKYKVVIHHQSVLPPQGAGDVRARVADAPAPDQVTVPPGLPGISFAFSGPAVPHVILTDPTGQQFDTGAGTDPVQTDTYLAVHDPSRDQTEIAIPNPHPGTWTIANAPGATPYTTIDQADGLPKPKISATVGGAGLKRTINYRISDLAAGDKVTFAEAGQSGGSLIGTAAPRATASAAAAGKLMRARGKLKFTPGLGPAETRPVYALVYDSNGFLRERLRVGSYHSPAPPGPPRVRHLKITRRGGRIMVSWIPPHGGERAHAYDVIVTLSDGRVLSFNPFSSHVSLPAVQRGVRVRAGVRPISLQAVQGPLASTAINVK